MATIITRDVLDGEMYLEKMMEIPYCNFDRAFSSDNLHHYVYTIYFKGGNKNE